MAGVRLPAEWEPQAAVLLTWPHSETDWAEALPRVEPAFVALAKEVTRFERLVVGCHDPGVEAHVRSLLSRADVPLDRVHLFLAPCNDTWARDHGPITVFRDGQLSALDFTFNGWGNKFNHGADNALNQRLFTEPFFNAGFGASLSFVLEGGSIESDGQGTILTSSKCLLNPNRNPGWSRRQIEGALSGHLGATRVLWLEHGHLVGDDTDAHIDTLVRLAPSNTLVHVQCDDPGDEHYAELHAMEAELQAFAAPNGRPYRLIALPWPDVCLSETGARLPATYANFLVINGAVLVPTYGSPKDRAAVDQLARAFPGREIIGIPCRRIIEQGGSLHCLTMQLPAGSLKATV